MHPAGARSSAARRDVVPLSQVTLARGLESDPPVVPAMSSLVGLRRCMLARIAIQAASGAASTCALPDSRVDIFSPVRRRFSPATGKSEREPPHGGRLQAAPAALEHSHTRIQPSMDRWVHGGRVPRFVREAIFERVWVLHASRPGRHVVVVGARARGDL